MPKKGWKNVSVKIAVVSAIRNHLKETEVGIVYPRSVARFVAEAVKNQIESETGNGSKQYA